MNRFASILLWSVIAAAFIGPGTVTTAASSGARFGLDLLWVLAFSTFACWVLQEASARLTMVSGCTLGAALRQQYHSGPSHLLVTLLVLGAVVAGCAAYQAGNILGGVAGATLAIGLSPRLLTVLLSAMAGALLWFQAPRLVAKTLSAVVALMGIAFLVAAWRIGPPVSAIARGTLVPTVPPGSALLVLGLLGTTVVPYNLFLGSALVGRESRSSLRWGLGVSIGIGGLISMGVLVVGTAVSGDFSFAALSTVLTDRIGGWGSHLLAMGLLGAGFSSAVTAPLAAALTAAQMMGQGVEDARWSHKSIRYRCVWLVVVITGLGFGASGIRPIPAIVAAQALNGLILPLVAIFLLLAVNDRDLMGESVNGPVSNVLLSLIAAVSLLLGVSAIARAVAASLGSGSPDGKVIVGVAVALAGVLAWPISRRLRERKGL